MIAMTKEEMINYLRDYALLKNKMSHESNRPIYLVFRDYMIEANRLKDCNRTYYDTMRHTYTMYCIMKRFSIIEDFLLNRDNYISEENLDDLKADLQSKYPLNNISNKRIIQLLRNAFNHNDDPNHNRFSLSKNGKNIEISFQDIRKEKEKKQGGSPKPIQIKFKQKDLIKIENEIDKSRENIMYLSYEIPDDFDILSDTLYDDLDNVKLIHYYFNRKLSKEEMEEFKRLGDYSNLSEEELLERSDEINNYAQSIGTFIKYELNDTQKEKIVDLVERAKTSYPSLLQTENSIYLMYYYLNQVIPIPSFKIFDTQKQAIFTDCYMLDDTLSLKNISDRLLLTSTDLDIPNNYDEIDKDIHNRIQNIGKPFGNRFFLDTIQPEFNQVFPIVMYFDSVITHYCNDEEITINDKKYNREKIRNSLAHCRWIISKDMELVLYDADPKNSKDYELEHVATIDIGSLIDWSDNYLFNKTKDKIINNLKAKKILQL